VIVGKYSNQDLGMLPKQNLFWIAIPSLSSCFFSKWGCPSLCIEEMYTALLYFNYSTKTGKTPYNNLTN
jgi:hypothetical protein